MLSSISKSAIWRSQRLNTQLYCVKVENIKTKEIRFEFLDYGYPVYSVVNAGGNPGMLNTSEFKGILSKNSTCYFEFRDWIVVEATPVT